MPDAHEAAVEAMAVALHAEFKPGGCAHVGKWHACRVNARTCLAALVRSEAVRAALVEAVDAAADEAVCKRGCQQHRHGMSLATDAILAALAPEAT